MNYRDFLATIKSANFPLVFSLAVIALFGSLFFTPAEPLKQKQTGKQGPDVEQPIEIPVIEDKTLDYGISFIHQQGDENLVAIDDVLGPGACVLDYDNDGWVDLFLVNGSGQTRYYGKPYWWQGESGNALLRNINGQRFEDVTANSGLSASFQGMGCVSADFDNDGDADLFITSLGNNRIYKNNGNASFSDITNGSGVVGEHWSTSATVADFNQDGLLDIYVANYVDFKKGIHTYEPSSQFSGDMPISFQGSYYQPQKKTLYQNIGNLQFKDVTREMNAENGDGRTLGVAWLDLNKDGWQDLVISNDKGVASNATLMNDKGKGFSVGNFYSGVNSSAGHRGISIGDINNDGNMDLVFASDKSNAPLLLVKDGSKLGYVDKARDMGIDVEYFSGFSGWTPGLFDFNNDGWLDLFLTNGLLVPDQDLGRVPLGQTKQLWMGTGGSQFREVSKQTGTALSDVQSARGAVFADFDNDGDIDAYVAHNNDLGQLLINRLPTGTHWLGLKLQATEGNRDAIGAEISVMTEAGKQTRVVTAGNGFLSDSDRRVHFGLGKAGLVKQLKIRWSDGSESTYADLQPDHYYHIRQGYSEISLFSASQSQETERPESLRLAFGEHDPVNRINYLKLLASGSAIGSVLPELTIGSGDAEPLVREAIINLSLQYKDARYLSLLTRLLDDSNSKIAAKAVDAICAYEDESSVRWLLRTFRSPAAEVRVKLANCFAYLYQEEEAVIHRKYLALPFLIRQLGDDQPQVRIAAARALANAERYRAVQPLIDGLDDPDLSVRAEAVRALGLIREGKAIPPILELLQSPGQTPEVYAQSLIALKRLESAGFTDIQQAFVTGTGQFESLRALQRLNTVGFIIENKDDGIVLNQSELIALVESSAKQSLPEVLSDEGGETAIALIDILHKSQKTETIAIVQALKNHPNPKVRIKAFAYLLESDRQNQTQAINDGLSDASYEAKRAILNASCNTGLAASLPEKPVLLALESTATRLAAINCLAKVPATNSSQRLYAIATDPTETPEAISAAIAGLTERSLVDRQLPDALARHPDARVRMASFLFWLRHQPAFIDAEQIPQRFADALEDADDSVQALACGELSKRQEAWAMRKIQAELTDAKASPKLRSCLMQNYKASNSVLAEKQLMEAALAKDDPLREQWLEKLLGSAGLASDAIAWQLLKDQTESPRVRMLAAKHLSPRHEQEVMTWLRKK